MTRSRFRSLLLLPLFSFFAVATSAPAYDLPSVNLGFTSFLDGGPPAGPGIYLTQYVQNYSADQLNGPDGSDLEIPGTDIEAWISLTQFLYQSDTELLLGGKWGLDVIVPYVSINADYDFGGPEANGAGFGENTDTIAKCADSWGLSVDDYESSLDAALAVLPEVIKEQAPQVGQPFGRTPTKRDFPALG